MDRETDREKEIRKELERKAELRDRLHVTLDEWLERTFTTHASYDDGTERTLKITVGQQDYVWSGTTEDRRREEI